MKNHWAYWNIIISLDHNFKQWNMRFIPEILRSHISWDGTDGGSLFKTFSHLYRELLRHCTLKRDTFCETTTTLWVRFVVNNFALIISLNLRQWVFTEEGKQNICIYRYICACVYMAPLRYSWTSKTIKGFRNVGDSRISYRYGCHLSFIQFP